MSFKMVEFEGDLSGDGESFVFNVDAATFKRVTGDAPTAHDAAVFGEGFRLYPARIFGFGQRRVRVKVEITYVGGEQ